MKRLFLAIVLVLCLCFNASSTSPVFWQASSSGEATTIQYDTYSKATAVGWGTTISWSHILTSSADSVLVVGVTAQGAAITSCDCNWDQDGTPVSMTALTRRQYPAVNNYAQMFYLMAPGVTGERTIQCTVDANSTITAGAVSIYNAGETGSGTTNEDGTTALATSISDTLTTGTDGSWVITHAFHYVNESIAPTQGETEIWEVKGVTYSAGMARELIATAGENTFGWNANTSGRWIINMAEFEIK